MHNFLGEVLLLPRTPPSSRFRLNILRSSAPGPTCRGHAKRGSRLLARRAQGGLGSVVPSVRTRESTSSPPRGAVSSPQSDGTSSFSWPGRESCEGTRGAGGGGMGQGKRCGLHLPGGRALRSVRCIAKLSSLLNVLWL
ncbi:uncharacterized protein LOC144579771 [Callithrix jacchus]